MIQDKTSDISALYLRNAEISRKRAAECADPETARSFLADAERYEELADRAILGWRPTPPIATTKLL